MWVDPLHFAWAALMVNQFEGRNLSVEGDIEVRIRGQANDSVGFQSDPLARLVYQHPSVLPLLSPLQCNPAAPLHALMPGPKLRLQ